MPADLGKTLTKRRPHLQYSLRALLLLTAAMAVWLGYVTNAARQQRNAVEALTASGAEVYYDVAFDESSDVPLVYSMGFAACHATGRDWQQRGIEDAEGMLKWLPAWVDRNLFCTVVAVRLNYPDWRLNNDSGNGRQLTVADLRAVSELVSLKGLDFDDAKFVTDDELSHLKTLTHLERLFLAGTNVGDAGLAKIAGLKRLRYLSLRGTKISDDGLAQLKGLGQLEMLELCDTNISDLGVKHLKSLKGLKHIFVSGTKITERGRKELKMALPNCEVADYPPGIVG